MRAAMSVAFPSIARCWSAVANPSGATGARLPTAWVAGLCSIATELADSAPSVGASSATAVGAVLSAGRSIVSDPVATAPTAAADAITVVRTDGAEGGGGPAMRCRAGTMVELWRARRPRGERCPATNLTFRRWGAIRSRARYRFGAG
jgi:hypothetical protein